jgi:hypothetical protein
MHVFRHNDVSQHDQAVTPPHTLQTFEEQVAASARQKQGLPVITTECQKMQIARSMESFWMGGYTNRVS